MNVVSSLVEDQLSLLEENIKSPRDIAQSRIRMLEASGKGFAAYLVSLIQEASESFFRRLALPSSIVPLSERLETSYFDRLLRVHSAICQLDSTLSEELGREGSHAILSRLLESNVSKLPSEEDQDTFMALQDIAGEIASLSRNFPLKFSPFIKEELKQRLPLEFFIHSVDEDNLYNKPSDENGFSILIHQIPTRQKEQKDVGFGECLLLGLQISHRAWWFKVPHVLKIQSCGRPRSYCRIGLHRILNKSTTSKF